MDAFPGEMFTGRIARVSPVLDPATRTAPIEIEIPNSAARLKPGMYARVSVTTSTRKQALVVPATAVVDLGGRRGVFTPLNESAVFRALDLGTEQKDIVEVLGGLAEGDTVITTGSSALRDGDRIVLPGGAAPAVAGGAAAARPRAAPAPGGAGVAARGDAAPARGGDRAARAAAGGAAVRRRRRHAAARRARRGSGREGGSREGRGRRGTPRGDVTSIVSTDDRSGALPSGVSHMSIPRLAIHRPVTMFMISGVITLLGVISLTRLPVDLMPEFEQPQLTVRTDYTGVGPLEMEELITRPMEQAVSAVPGVTRVESTSSEGNSQVRLNFDWGTDLSRGRRRSPHPRRPHAEPAARGRRPADDLQVRREHPADHPARASRATTTR